MHLLSNKYKRLDFGFSVALPYTLFPNDSPVLFDNVGGERLGPE